MSFKFFDKLSQDFSELLNDKKEYNVVIEVDKEGNKKSFTAHSVVLRYRSSYFDKELENATTNKNHIKTIIKPNISAQIFEIILRYVYGVIVNIEYTDTKIIYDLMVNANELELKELSVKLESYLIESKASWLRTHFSFIYHSIFNNNFDSNEFKGLKKFYNDIIAKHPNLIFESEGFTSIQETTLVSILKRDDLQVEEVKIWDYVIKWGISQNSTLPTNLEEWSNENFMALKLTLQRCLPLIRYFHIPSEDIRKNVRPYKKILESQLWDDITQYFMFPNKPVKSLVLPARIISPILSSRIISAANLSSVLNLPSRIISTPNLPSRIISAPNLSPAPNLPSRIISTPNLFSTTRTTLNLPSRIISAPNLSPALNLSSRIISTPNLSSITRTTSNLPSNLSPAPNLPSRIIPTPNLPSTPDLPLIFIPTPGLAFSTVINKKHVAELSSWIDRRSTTYHLVKIPYEFQLILRGSRDNFHPKTFWNMCHGCAGTIVVAKVAETDEIVGGYNPLAWDNSTGGAYMKTKDSFIFSLEYDNIRKSSIISRVEDQSGALLYYKSNLQDVYGPSFGYSEFVMESNVSNFTRDEKSICCYISSCHAYKKPIRTTNERFSIVDYEVFKIIKN
ncbi:hypothetical protein Glove_482g44 [Diversispora epigaea]|uniref:BTB domain-containing protein n=1 Tax=Diversispora epigaea TaxID=1348612 RepID=A0A397GJM5_9GLOM|nr:hypothetical protein Glove_482g44 [Diversispora epigaea]